MKPVINDTLECNTKKNVETTTCLNESIDFMMSRFLEHNYTIIF